MLAGVNDSARARPRAGRHWSRDVPCKFNLIPFNPFPQSGFRRSPPDTIRRFRNVCSPPASSAQRGGRAATTSTRPAASSPGACRTGRAGRRTVGEGGPMTRMLRATLIAAAALVLAAGCASQQEPQVQRAQPTDPGYGPVIGDVKDGRTRAKAHTDLAAAYYELGNLGVALEEARIALQRTRAIHPRTTSGPGQHGAQGPGGCRRELPARPQARTAGSRAQHNYGWFLCQTGRGAAVDPVVHERDQEPALPDAAKSYAAAGRCPQKREPGGAAEYSRARPAARPEHRPGDRCRTRRYLYRRGQLTQAKELVGRYNKMLPEPTPEALWLGSAHRAQARRSPGRGEPGHPAAPALSATRASTSRSFAATSTDHERFRDAGAPPTSRSARHGSSPPRGEAPGADASPRSRCASS